MSSCTLRSNIDKAGDWVRCLDSGRKPGDGGRSQECLRGLLKANVRLESEGVTGEAGFGPEVSALEAAGMAAVSTFSVDGISTLGQG